MLNAIVTVLGTAFLGMVAWSAKLRSDVNVNDQKVTDLKELIGTQLANIDRRLERIEKGLNGTLRRNDGYGGWDHH